MLRSATSGMGVKETRCSMPTVTTPLPDLILYGRPGCDLCGETRDLLLALLRERAAAGRPVPVLQERDIETDAAWQHMYRASIPVVELGGQRIDLATSVIKLRRLLSDVLDADEAR